MDKDRPDLIDLRTLQYPELEAMDLVFFFLCKKQNNIMKKRWANDYK